MDTEQIPELPPFFAKQADEESDSQTGKKKYTQTPWHTRLEQLLAYKEEHGDTNVPRSYSNKPLAKWVSKQRQLYRSGKLLQDRVDQLDEVEFAWTGSRKQYKHEPDEKSWDEQFANLLEYRKEFGNVDVPAGYKKNNLGYWVKRQRASYKKDTISELHIVKLERIGFRWRLQQETELGWEARYEELLQYMADNGHCDVPQKYALNQQLAKWVSFQRQLYKKGTLLDARIAKLNEVGFSWQIREVSSFETRFETLVEYKQQHGNCNVPPNVSLGRWVRKLRERYKTGRLSQGQVTKLNSIDFCWSRREEMNDEWTESYNELVKMKETHGTCNDPIHFEANPRLRAWTAFQRSRYKVGRLSDERVAKLQDVGLNFEAPLTRKRTKNAVRAVDSATNDCKAGAESPATRNRCTSASNKTAWITTAATASSAPATTEAAAELPVISGKDLSASSKIRSITAAASTTPTATDAAAELPVISDKDLSASSKIRSITAAASMTPTPSPSSPPHATSATTARTTKTPYSLQSLPSTARTRYKAVTRTSTTTTSPAKRLSESAVRKNRSWESLYKSLQCYHKKHGHTNVPSKANGKLEPLGQFVQRQRTAFRAGKLTADKIKRLEDIGFEWRKCGVWEKHFRSLIRYKEENGDCLVPRHFKPNPLLGGFVLRQRAAFKAGKLSEDKVSKLNEIGFVWRAKKSRNSTQGATKTTEPSTGTQSPTERNCSIWLSHYENLVKYHEEYGNCNVPPHKDVALSGWVHRTRKRAKKGKLSNDQINKLTDIGFEFDRSMFVGQGRPLDPDRWNAQYTNLLAYKHEHGDCLVPGSFQPNRKLTAWVCHQRKLFRTGKLSQDRIDKLNDAGFCWHAGNKDESFDARFNDLMMYKQQHGHCLVSFGDDSCLSLARWVGRLRTGYREGKLSAERIAKLEDVGFVWSVQKKKDTIGAAKEWDGRYNELKNFHSNFGHCNVKSTYNKELLSWLQRQREKYNAGKLSEKRISKLEKLGVGLKTGQKKINWDARFDQLVAYKQTHGNCNVSIKDEDNKKLGVWVAWQRTIFRRGEISSERVEKLNSIGFAWSLNKKRKANTD